MAQPERQRAERELKLRVLAIALLLTLALACGQTPLGAARSKTPRPTASATGTLVGGGGAGVGPSRLVAPYTDRVARQDARLDECRDRFDPDYDFDAIGEFGPYVQGIGLICELVSRERGRSDHPRLGKLSDEEIDELMSRLLARLSVGVGIDGRFGDPRPACRKARKKGRDKRNGAHEDESEASPEPGVPICFRNIVIARYATFFTAYMLHRFTEVDWTTETLEAAHRLYAEGNWYPWAGRVSNSTLPLAGMRLLGGEFFEDPVLIEYGRTQIYASRDHVPRHSPAEPTAPHYGGSTLNALAMLLETEDPEIRGILENLLAVSLLVPAHLYLPGGGLGAPQEREKSGGGIADPDPTAAGHLVPALNMMVHDPELLGAGHSWYSLAADYQAPEIIRSIFLDKGPGYTFEYRGGSASRGHTQVGWYDGRRSYGSLGRGIVTADPRRVEVNPWAAVMLPGGRAQMGIMYGSGGGKANSAGVYIRKPGPPRGDKHRDFSILYQHQPRRPYDPRKADPRKGASEEGPYDPLVDDPTWHWERKSGSRRMLYGRTALALFEVTGGGLGMPANAGPASPSPFAYTMVHLPDFSDPEVGDGMQVVPSETLPGHRWFVGRSGDAYVAYLPLGRIAERRDMADEQGNWIYLQLSGPVSGGITELATTADYPTLESYAADLRARYVDFRGSNPGDCHAEIDVREAGGVRRIRLEFAGDRRFVDGARQPDSEFLLLGDVMRSPFVEWDDARFTLTVTRAGYPPLALNFGDPSIPTPPRKPLLEVVGGLVRVRWKHGYDDVGITAYDVYRNGEKIGSVDGQQLRFDDRSPVRGSRALLAGYRIASRDGDGNVSETRTRILQVREARTSRKARR